MSDRVQTRRRWINQVRLQVGWSHADINAHIADEFPGKTFSDLNAAELHQFGKDLCHLRTFQQWRAGVRPLNPRSLEVVEVAGL